MVKEKKRIFAFSVMLVIFFLSTINGAISVAASTSSPSSAGETQMQGDGLTFNIQKGYPIPQNGYPVQYGVIIPETNMWTSYEVQASNQGIFKIKRWDDFTHETTTIDNPGDDISLLSPWYIDYMLNSLTNDNLNPWNDIKWIQADASIAENDTLNPYTVNSIWKYYIMTESSPLTVPLIDSIPIQVDMIIRSSGPKVLKCNIDGINSYIDSAVIISPSGIIIDSRIELTELDGDELFYYYMFVAHEVGTYRLLLQHIDYPYNIDIEFLDFNLNNLPQNTRTYGGTCDETPSWNDYWASEWMVEWWKFSGSKGDKFILELWEDFSYDYTSTDFLLFTPTCDAYEISTASNINEIYMPTAGNFYIAVVHNAAPSLYRYSLLLKQIPVIGYNIGDELTTIKISKDERKAIEFKVPQDSFVRFNYTFDLALPTGTETELDDFIFEDAKKYGCYEIIGGIDKKTVSGETFYYYYMPAGTYEAIIRNDDDTENGIFQISSNYINWATDDIPINTLVYPEIYPSQFESFEFEPDDYDPSLKQAQALTFDITGPGQFFLNTSIWGSENLAAIPATQAPTYYYYYNNTGAGSYHTSDYPIPIYSTDGDGTWEDLFLIGSPYKFTGVKFNFTEFALPGEVSHQYFWDGSSWNQITSTSIDNTNDLSQNGTIEFAIDPNFFEWEKGCPYHPFYGPSDPIDIPMVNEDDYYWFVLHSWTDYTPNISIVADINLLNTTIFGDINLALLRDSGYEHCDVWDNMEQPAQISNFMISQDEDIPDYDSDFSPIIKNGDPWTIGIEEGTYTLLVIPEHWDYEGNINLDFAIVDYWGYRHEVTYNINSQPIAYPWNITSGIIIPGYHQYNYTNYPFSPAPLFNNDEVEIPNGAASGEGYYVLDCYGSAYNWTQLVLQFRTNEISTMDIYLMQDLPWIDNNGPNSEVRQLAANVVANTTMEFGVFSDHFYLIFEYTNSPSEYAVRLWIDLNQYNTDQLTTTAIVASEMLISGNGDDDDDDDDNNDEFLTSIPGWTLIELIAAIGAGISAIAIYLKKKRKIF